MSSIGAAVLCGGQSSRMGRPKAWLPFGHDRMLARVVRIVSQVADPIVVVAANQQRLPELPIPVLHAVDSAPARGPLQGLLAGLEALPGSVELVYATATDVPFLNPEWITHLIQILGDDDIAIAQVGGYHHPLAALYRRSVVLPEVRSLLADDRLRPFFLLERCKVRTVSEPEMRSIDPDLGTLHNLNTPQDYLEALDKAGFDRPEVAIELHGVSRLKAGIARFTCRATSVGEALQALLEAAPSLAGTILAGGRLHPAYKLSLNTDLFVDDPDTLVVQGDELLLIAADVGG